MNITYKYYFYYLIDIDKETNKLKLYAYTDDKRLASMFESFRDMTKFKKKKRHITKEEVNNLARNNRISYLKPYELNTYDRFNNIEYSILTAITIDESLLIQSKCANITCGGTIFANCLIPSYIFNEEIKDSLDIILYTKCNEYMTTKDDLVYPEFKPDELSIFIRYYGKTIGH